MLSRLAFDAMSALVLALTALLGAYLPAHLAKQDRLAGGTGRSLTYVLGNMLSAGVMVSAGFCHLLGEALKQMPKMTFPLAPFLCGTGYLFTLVADKVAASAHGGGHHGCGGGHGLPSRGPATDSCCAVEVLAGIDIAERGMNGAIHAEKHTSSDELEGQGLLDRPPSRNGRLAQVQQGGSGSIHIAAEHAATNGGIRLGDSQLAADHGGDRGQGLGRASLDGFASVPPAGSRRRPLTHRDSTESLVFEMEQPGGAILSPATSSMRRVSFLTAVLMGVALCFHSLLEGAAMGAQTTISNSLHIFIAIVSHKGLAAYALGSSIVDSEASMQRFWSVVLPFTFASPVGIFIGYVISDIAKGVGAASISALASGTFLYVAFMEVIPKELRDSSNVVAKLAALLAGYALMSLLAVWA